MVVRTSWPAVPLAAFAVVVGGPQPRTALLLFVAAVTPLLVSADLLEHRLPNRLVLPGYGVAALAIAGEWWRSGTVPVAAVLAGAGAFGVMLLFAIAGGMGMGDVKLAGMLGLAAGLLGPAASLGWLPAGFLAGGVAAVLALRRDRGASIPFGPYLLAGFWAVALLSRGASWT